MTKNEFMERYGHELVVFQSYYKYAFTYVGKTKAGNDIILTCGGDPGDIYKWDVVANVPERVDEAGAFYGKVTDPRTNEVMGEFDEF